MPHGIQPHNGKDLLMVWPLPGSSGKEALMLLATEQGCHLLPTSKFPDFSLTFYSFPYPMTDHKISFILYHNDSNCIPSKLGVTLKRKNLLLKGANSFL